MHVSLVLDQPMVAISAKHAPIMCSRTKVRCQMVLSIYCGGAKNVLTGIYHAVAVRTLMSQKWIVIAFVISHNMRRVPEHGTSTRH